MADTIKNGLARLAVNQESFAEMVGVSPPLVSHWINYRERVTEDRAPFVASVLGVKPGDVSLAYKYRMAPIDDLHRDIQALRFAVTGVAKAISAMRPVEGEAFDAEIRDAAGAHPEFLDGQGFLGYLLGQIGEARSKSEAASQPFPVQKAASTSRRK